MKIYNNCGLWHFLPAHRLKTKTITFSLLIVIFLTHTPGNGSQMVVSIEVNDSPQQMGKRLMDYINTERKNRDLVGLDFDQKLCDIALAHSIKMAREKKLSHVFSGYNSLKIRLMKGGVFFSRCGENVALSETPVSKLIHEFLMNSPGHRVHIIDPLFTHCGIGVFKRDDRWYTTQIFARLFTPIKRESIKTILKEQVKTWLGKEQIFVSPIDAITDKCAKRKLKGYAISSTLRTIPKSLGKFLFFSLISPDFEEIKGNLKKKLLEMNINKISIGVTFSRSVNQPGGAYSVACVIFGSRYQSLLQKDLVQLILEKVNGLRKEKGLMPFELDTHLSKDAIQFSVNHFKFPEKAIPPSNTKFPVIICHYKTYDINDIPPNVQQKILTANKRKKSIGIGIFFPPQLDLPGNYFLVTLILRSPPTEFFEMIKNLFLRYPG